LNGDGKLALALAEANRESNLESLRLRVELLPAAWRHSSPVSTRP